MCIPVVDRSHGQLVDINLEFSVTNELLLYIAKRLECVILDYMYKRGFHQTSEAFSNEIRANQNPVVINSPHEAFLQVWWGKFFEAYKSRFPDDAVLNADFNKVTQTVENIVANNDLHQSYASDHMEANISNVMPVMSSPHLMTSLPVMESTGPDLMDAEISNFLSSYDTDYALLVSSSQRGMTSGLQFTEMAEMGGMLPLASNSGYQMQQMPTAPAKWNARDDRPGINLGGPTQMEPSIHAPANALPASLELSDSGNNRSLQQASHHGWPSVMLGDTDQRTLEYLPADQQRILMRRSRKQPAMQESINQTGLQSSNKSGIKRKTPLSSLASVWKKARVTGVAKNKTIICYSRGDVGPVSALSSIYARTKEFAKPTCNQDDTFKEISNLDGTTSKLLCCHFNSKGELLATSGDDGKILIWELGNNNAYGGGGHAQHVTDVRFRPNSTMFATSSFDRTVKIWDATELSNPFQNLVGHCGHVMSIDFHPIKVDLLSSSDSNDEIRLWDVNRGDSKLNFKGGIRQVRFQPERGDFLASSTGNIINIFDVETNNIQRKLQGHVKDILSICWEMSGNYLASVSEDSARIWSVRDGKCIHELHSSGNKFQSCTFHPGHPLVLVIGSDKFLKLWNPTFQSNITKLYGEHSGIISSLADSPSKGIVASVSHDQWIKIWR